MERFKNCIISLFVEAFIVHFMHCASSDLTAENVSPHHHIDLELRLGPSMPAIQLASAQPHNVQPTSVQATDKNTGKRKRKDEENVIHGEIKYKITTWEERRREISRLNAIKRRKEIKEKVKNQK